MRGNNKGFVWKITLKTALLRYRKVSREMLHVCYAEADPPHAASPKT